MVKSYRVRERAPQEVHTALAGHPELVRELLFGRGVEDAESAGRFLEPDFLRDSHDPFLMPDMEEAVARVCAAAHAGELVCVWSDYDCDGIPGGVALGEFLRAIGCQVRHYIPHRHEEGYGLNGEGLRQLAREGVELVITVDLGTGDIAQAALARTLGLDLIITDHHLPTDDIPDALALLNPYRADSNYPFSHLCGAGVAWKLIQGVLARERSLLPEGQEKWLLDLVGLATLSDMVPLVDENRMLASYGLLVMRKTKRPGLQALFSLLRMRPHALSEDDLTFMISPRINAASRMGSPETAARLLATSDREEGDALARELQHLNDERKGVVAAIVKEVRSRLRERESASDIIVMGSPHWRPGVLGLVANTLVDSEGVPVFLWGREGSELLKGSCRSPNVNVVLLMAAAGGIFADFGGHELSGGFSLMPERAHELAGRLTQAYEHLRTSHASARETVLDRELDLADASLATLSQVRRLGPFGESNRKPLFLFPGALVSRQRMFGKRGDHLELTLTRGATRIAGISFFATPESFQKVPREGLRADIVGHLEADFRGAPRVRVVDII